MYAWREFSTLDPSQYCFECLIAGSCPGPHTLEKKYVMEVGWKNTLLFLLAMNSENIKTIKRSW